MHTHFVTITQARKEIFSLTDTVAKKNTVVTLTEHGLPKAILLSLKRYAFLERKSTPAPFSESVFSFFPDSARLVQDAPKNRYTQDTTSLLSIPSSRGNIDPFSNEKKLALAQLFVQLAEKYDCPPENMYLDTCLRVDGHHGNHTVDIDILLTDTRKNPVALFLVAPFQHYETLKDRMFRDLFTLCDAFKRTYRCDTVRNLVYFSKTVNAGKGRELWSVVDTNAFPSFKQWKREGCPTQNTFSTHGD